MLLIFQPFLNLMVLSRKALFFTLHGIYLISILPHYFRKDSFKKKVDIFTNFYYYIYMVLHILPKVKGVLKMPEIELVDTNLLLRNIIAKINYILYDLVKKLSEILPFLKRA